MLVVLDARLQSVLDLIDELPKKGPVAWEIRRVAFLICDWKALIEEAPPGLSYGDLFLLWTEALCIQLLDEVPMQ